jgi:hypothetical protein
MVVVQFGILVEYNREYRADGDGLELHADEDPDGWYPSRFRGSAQILLEYVWALGQLTDHLNRSYSSIGTGR